MWSKSKIETLPQELTEPLKEMDLIIRSYLAGLGFIVRDTARDDSYWNNHLLSYLAQDLLESAISIISLGMEGLTRTAKRELRFIIETSIKLCFVQEKDYDSPVSGKLRKFDKELSSQRISINRNLGLGLLPEDLRQTFIDEAGRIYGVLCDYVHLTPRQIQERIAAVDAGRTAGKESAGEIEDLNILIARALAVSLTLLFHSVPSYVAGDWLVESDGSSMQWYFSASRFLAAIDAHFDYKHERQSRLTEIQSARETAIRF